MFETKDKNLMMLKSILMRPDIEVIYSHVTIDEIGQIIGHKNDGQYFREHYRVLEQLEAKYINPSSKKLIDEKPHKTALNYVKNKRASYNTPYPYLATIMEDFSRKLSGLPIDRSLKSIGENMIQSTNDIVNITIEQINSLNVNEFEEPMKSIIANMKENIPNLLKNSLPNSNPFNNANNIPLGTKPFREHKPIKKFMDSQPSRSDVIIEMKYLLKEGNSMASMNSFVDKSIENKIFYAYTLMNWFGYYADDFDKVKKNKDRFNASQNDVRHASYAHMANFLISNDKAFCEKTIVSYEFADLKTIVCSPEFFLKNY